MRTPNKLSNKTAHPTAISTLLNSVYLRAAGWSKAFG